MSLLFDELFAIRISLQEYLMDEKKIIRELKLHLNNKIPNDEINDTITNFYKSFGIEFSDEFISEIENNVPIIIPTFNQLVDSSDNSIIEEVDSDEDSIIDQIDSDNESNIEEANDENINSTQNFINTMFDILDEVNNINLTNENTNTMEDVKVTLDERDIEKLQVLNAEEDLDVKCCICMLDIEKDNKYCKLDCEHSFHESCIKNWFENFNYKCPICRKECGKAKYHI